MKGFRLSLWAATVPIVVLLAGFGVWIRQQGIPGAPWVYTVLCLGLLLIGYFALGSGETSTKLQRWIQDSPSRVAVFPLTLWAIYLLYALGVDAANLRRTGLVGLYLAGPFLLLAPGRQREGKPPLWLDFLAMLWLWFPADFGWLHSLFASPAHRLHYFLGQLLAVNLGLATFVLWRCLPGIGYRFECNGKIMRTGVSHFLLFAVLAIPLGLGIGFLHYSYSSEKWLDVPPSLVFTFLFTALPEELLFRGLIQNWFELRTGSPLLSLLLAALLFGAAHLNNGPPYPNWSYFGMASLAGLFYGRVWQHTRSLMSPALAHTLVNTAWGLLFR